VGGRVLSQSDHRQGKRKEKKKKKRGIGNEAVREVHHAALCAAAADVASLAQQPQRKRERGKREKEKGKEGEGQELTKLLFPAWSDVQFNPLDHLQYVSCELPRGRGGGKKKKRERGTK